MDYAAGFEIGSHVIIERNGDARVAGVLLGQDEEGLLVSVTHETVQVMPKLDDGMHDSIREELEELSTARLRLMGVMSGIRGALRMDRYALVDRGVEQVVKGIEGAAEPVERLQVLRMPVKTYMTYSSVWAMESLSDRNDNAILGELLGV